jgi:hypothetical protein
MRARYDIKRKLTVFANVISPKKGYVEMTHCCEQNEGTAAPEAGGHRCEHHKEKKYTNFVVALLAIAAVILVFNQYQIMSLADGGQAVQTAAQTVSAAANFASVSPTGTPAIYGSELGVKYSDVSASDAALADKTITKLGNLDKTITLTGNNLKRYIAITSQMSCEYCCGADSIIFTKDSGKYKAGDAACGCAHSYAMRGLAKYLITKHPDVKDDAILEELGKWKTLFFPDVMAQKAAVMKQKGIEFNYINLASNKYRGIEKDAQASAGGGNMVGGC